MLALAFQLAQKLHNLRVARVGFQIKEEAELVC